MLNLAVQMTVAMLKSVETTLVCRAHQTETPARGRGSERKPSMTLKTPCAASRRGQPLMQDAQCIHQVLVERCLGSRVRHPIHVRTRGVQGPAYGVAVR